VNARRASQKLLGTVCQPPWQRLPASQNTRQKNLGQKNQVIRSYVFAPDVFAYPTTG
jgi:hypothetical protein